MLKLIASLAFLVSASLARHNILDYGAVPDSDKLKDEKANAKAFYDAVVAANSTETLADREVYVPANMSFSMMAVDELDNWSNVVVTIDGTIKLSKRHHFWPLTEQGAIRDFFMFRHIQNVTF